MQAIPQALLSEGSSAEPTDLSDDARLRRGLIETDVSRRCALALTLTFLALLYGIPLSQALLEHRAGDESSLAGLFQRAPSAENLRAFEREIEQASYIKDFVQPRVQLLLSELARVGNKRTVIGRDGWLYYTPGLAHVAGPSFIDPDALLARVADSETAIQPDPRPAIFAFARMLAERQISLILFPVPDKVMLQPQQLHGRGQQHVSNNVGFDAFARELRACGISVLEPAPRALGAADPPRFLVQDTHWTPAWMDEVARQLATAVTKLDRGPGTPARAQRVVRQQVERVGDLVDMLKLPDDQSAFRPQTITIEQVQDQTGALWQSNPQADVLLLGDSFTNVFSEDVMGWGEAAGLAPHLSLALGRDVDVIAQNDSGAFATRQALARALAAGEDRLAGKRVVIWELASRELSVGDWKHVDWPIPASVERSGVHVDWTCTPAQ